MSLGKTVMGTRFEYSGTLETGITVYFEPTNKKKTQTKLKISGEIIRVIRQEITNRSPVRMGANRDNPAADSVGETLKLKYDEVPQVMSYVLPLLVEEGFCTVSDGKPYIIHRTNQK